MDMMSAINTMLVNAMGPLGPLIAVGGLGLFLVLLTLPIMMKRPTDPMEKLQRSIKLEAQAKKVNKGPELRSGGKTDKLQKFSAFLEPQDAGEMGAAKLEMLRAGYRAKNAVRTYHAAQFALGIGLLIVGVIYAMIKSAQAPLTMQSMLLYTLLPGAIGYYMPRHYIKKRVAKRQQEIVEGFPDALDMMLVCVEAGQSLDQSILRVAKELHSGYPALAEEFELVSHEVKAGKQRVTVLKDMAERCGVPDVASFVTVLVQSTTFGTSIADALRIYASEMRDKRVMRAEEKANTIPTKLTLGTMLFTVPPLMIILIGPAIQGIATMLSSNHF